MCGEVEDEAQARTSETRLRRELRVVMRRARDRMHLSQEGFARALSSQLGHNVSQSQISDWERGRFEAGASVLLAIGELTGVSIDELRGASSSAVLDRLDRLEADLEELNRGVTSSPQDGHETTEERLASLEREWERMGSLLAKIIEVLDEAGQWPTDQTGPQATTERPLSRRPPAAGTP
jgi:transcriptional regulator with XRE-family HTH domain